MNPNPAARAKVFISYAHLDQKFRSELGIQLTILENKGYLEWWSDQRLIPGDEFEAEILEKLKESDIILLLVSSYFLASTFCWTIELKEAIRRHDNASSPSTGRPARRRRRQGIRKSRTSAGSIRPRKDPVLRMIDPDLQLFSVRTGQHFQVLDELEHPFRGDAPMIGIAHEDVDIWHKQSGFKVWSNILIFFRPLQSRQ